MKESQLVVCVVKRVRIVKIMERYVIGEEQKYNGKKNN